MCSIPRNFRKRRSSRHPSTRTDATHGTITGDLTIRDVTKPVTLDVTFTGTELNPLDDSRVLGFQATATIKRSDFGMTGMIWEPLVGDDVKLIIEAMFQQRERLTMTIRNSTAALRQPWP